MTAMTYYDSAEGETITKARAFKELEKHGVADDCETFLVDMGDKAEYDVQEVLRWLGY